MKTYRCGYCGKAGHMSFAGWIMWNEEKQEFEASGVDITDGFCRYCNEQVEPDEERLVNRSHHENRK